MKLVAFPSINPPGAEREISDFVLRYLSDAGIATQCVEAGHGRSNVIATIRGSSSRRGLLFTGHMDVVPVRTEERMRWDTDPFEPVQKDGAIFGRGACDMKSGLACAMTAMKAIAEDGILPERDIFLVATVDEEDGMRGSKALADHPLLKEASEVIVCEPTGLQVCTAGKGRTYGELDVRGHTGHGSVHDAAGNAILIANRIMNEIEACNRRGEEHPVYGRSFWQPLAIEAGVEPCVVPDRCIMKIDARLIPGAQPADAWEQIQTILRKTERDLPGHNVAIRVIDAREPWELDADAPLRRKVRRAFDAQGLDYKETFFPGTTDGTILRRAGRDVIIVGPGELQYAHRENEHVRVEEVRKALGLYEALMRGKE